MYEYRLELFCGGVRGVSGNKQACMNIKCQSRRDADPSEGQFCLWLSPIICLSTKRDINFFFVQVSIFMLLLFCFDAVRHFYDLHVGVYVHNKPFRCPPSLCICFLIKMKNRIVLSLTGSFDRSFLHAIPRYGSDLSQHRASP